MTIKVGISGFGRIGKLVYRIIDDLVKLKTLSFNITYNFFIK